MRLLLDTHVALWAILADRRLAKPARQLIETLDNEIYISAASVWEISIKHSLSRGRRRDMPISGHEALAFFRQAGYGLLAVTAEHAAAVGSLAPIHTDPFDRILVAQAEMEPLRLLTHDARLAGYGTIVQVV